MKAGLAVGCVAVGLACLPGVAGATTGTEVGGMNLSAYCQQLEAGNKGATVKGETWVCIHADNTTATLNLQAACEHEYKQRPIKAEEITPGVPFSWKCFQISQAEAEAEAGKGGEKPGTGNPGGGSGAATTTGVTCALTFASFSETCTVVVSGGSSAPTGTVTFASAGGGVFQFGNTCQLAPAAQGSSCHVVFLPPSRELGLILAQAITASYPGDTSHLASSNHTSLIASQQESLEQAVKGTEEGFNPAEALKHGLPVSVETVVPGTAEVEVICGVTGGSTLPVLRPRGGQLCYDGAGSALPVLRAPKEGETAPGSTTGGSTLPVLKPSPGSIAFEGGGSTLPVLRPREATATVAKATRGRFARIARLKVALTAHGGIFKLRIPLNKVGRRELKAVIRKDLAYDRRHRGAKHPRPPILRLGTIITFTPAR